MFFFAFSHAHGGVTRTTLFSRENQLRIVEAYNQKKLDVDVFHLVQFGEYAGELVKRYVINFHMQTVTNTENNIVHRLVMD